MTNEKVSIFKNRNESVSRVLKSLYNRINVVTAVKIKYKIAEFFDAAQRILVNLILYFVGLSSLNPCPLTVTI